MASLETGTNKHTRASARHNAIQALCKSGGSSVGTIAAYAWKASRRKLFMRTCHLPCPFPILGTPLARGAGSGLDRLVDENHPSSDKVNIWCRHQASKSKNPDHACNGRLSPIGHMANGGGGTPHWRQDAAGPVFRTDARLSAA